MVSLHDYFVNEIRYISGPVEEKMGEDQNLQKKIFTIQTSWPAMQIREMLVNCFVSDAGKVK